MDATYPVNMAAIVIDGITWLYFVDKQNGHIKYYKTKNRDESLGIDYEGPETITGIDPSTQKAYNPIAATYNARIAATTYIYDNKQQVRLYYCDSENQLQELCWTDGLYENNWYNGQLSEEKYALSTEGGLEAAVVRDGQLKVYCLKDGTNVPTCWYIANGGGLWQERKLKGQNE